MKTTSKAILNAPTDENVPTTDENVPISSEKRFAEELAIHEVWEAKLTEDVEQENAQCGRLDAAFYSAQRAYALPASELELISTMSTPDLHNATVEANNIFREHCAKTHAWAVQRLIPLCEEIIRRIKMPGVKDRPNGQPTVEAYFKSIGLNYNTVRTWFARSKWSQREKLKTGLFMTPQYRPHFPMIEVDGSPYARRGPDFEKIRKYIEKAVFIADGHNIDARSVGRDFLIYVGKQFGIEMEEERH